MATMSDGYWSFSISEDGIILHHQHKVPTPTSYQNPVEYYSEEKAKIHLPEGWKWSPEPMRAAPPQSEVVVVKNDGALANPAALPKLIEVVAAAGETELANWLCGLDAAACGRRGARG